MLWWHNETGERSELPVERHADYPVNIYSHTIGCLLFALAPIHSYYTLYSKIERAKTADAFIFLIYCFGVSVCFACSARYVSRTLWSIDPGISAAKQQSSSCHIVWNLNAKAASSGNKLDFAGIVLLMWGAGVASIHFAFICQPHMRMFYWLIVCQCLPFAFRVSNSRSCNQMSISAGGCVAFTFYARFITPAFRMYRAMMYSSLGLSGVIFILHSLYMNGVATGSKRLGLSWMVLMGLLNLIGAALYAARVSLRNLGAL